MLDTPLKALVLKTYNNNDYPTTAQWEKLSTALAEAALEAIRGDDREQAKDTLLAYALITTHELRALVSGNPPAADTAVERTCSLQMLITMIDLAFPETKQS